MLMRRRDHRQIRQLDLFGLPDPTGFAQPVPAWRVLPEETRRAVTELMARLLFDHGRVDHRPIRMEVVDDV
jgi:DNA-directed RNA polymerase specialized sigma24 family protein